MLKEAFDACLHALVEHVGEGTCSCFDEETVLTHIYQRLAPCKDLPVKRPVANCRLPCAPARPSWFGGGAHRCGRWLLRPRLHVGTRCSRPQAEPACSRRVQRTHASRPLALLSRPVFVPMPVIAKCS